MDNAVNVVVNGRARDIHLYTAQGSGNTLTLNPTPNGERPWYKRAKSLFGFVVGLATIAAGVIAWLQFR